MKIAVDRKINILDFLLEKLGYRSRTKARKLIKYGTVAIDGRKIDRSDITLLPGQSIEITHSKPPGPTLPFKILYEDDFLVAVEKPEGILSVSTDSEKTKTLYRNVYEYVKCCSKKQKRLFIVHRLDRDVSGVILFAKSQKVKELLQNNWGKTEKLYYALVEGCPNQKEGVIKSWLLEAGDYKVSSIPREKSGAKFAVTHYRTIREFGRYAILEIRLETGRKNQIRVHLADINCPVAGDKKYGAKTDPIKRIGLHAFYLAFTHPITGEAVVLTSPMPKSFTHFGSRPRS
jgi:23S rRNA pseudouridine1911/1915/1917 synthase